MFEKASKMKLRFDTAVIGGGGHISADDLWDLPLGKLDTLAIAAHSALRATEGEVSFVTEKPKVDRNNQLRLEILKRVIQVKQEQDERTRKLSETRERNRQIMEIISRKQDKALEGKSIAQLTKLLEQGEAAEVDGLSD